jgi:YesN/AraC family two-component response regulator
MEENRRAAMDSGVDDFLSKPCAEDELFQIAQKYLGLNYLLEEEKALDEVQTGVGGKVLHPADICGKLPQNVIAELQQAVGNGEKDYLDELIGNVAKFDTPAARTLRQLADNYEYDALTHLLEEVRA